MWKKRNNSKSQLRALVIYGFSIGLEKTSGRTVASLKVASFPADFFCACCWKILILAPVPARNVSLTNLRPHRDQFSWLLPDIAMSTESYKFNVEPTYSDVGLIAADEKFRTSCVASLIRVLFGLPLETPIRP